MDSYLVNWISSSGTVTDISARAGNISTSDDLDSICVSMTMDVQHSVLDRYHAPLGIQPGERIAFYKNGSLVLDGHIASISGNYREKVQLSVNDDGALLTKNDLIIQFNGVTASTAISQLCIRLGISVGEIPDMQSKITKIYHEAVSSIIEDILKTVNADTGKEYFVRVKNKRLYVKEYADSATSAYFRQSSNLPRYPIQNQLGTASVKWSIEDLKNVIQIYSDQNGGTTVLSTASDAESIAQNGRRVKAETFSDQDGVSAAQKAKNLLEELNTVSEEVSIHCYGSDDVSAGVALEFDTEEFEGVYLVKSCSKSYGQPEEMDLTLRRIEK